MTRHWGALVTSMKPVNGALRATPHGLTNVKYEVYDDKIHRWVALDKWIPAWFIAKFPVGTQPGDLVGKWNEFVNSITELTFYGIRLSDTEVDASVFRCYNNTLEMIVLNGGQDPAWGETGDRARGLAALMLSESVSDVQLTRATTYQMTSLQNLFLENIVFRLPRFEWTLSSRIIREWADAMLEEIKAGFTNKTWR